MRWYAAAALAAGTLATGVIPATPAHDGTALPALTTEAWRATNAFVVTGIDPPMPESVRAWFATQRELLTRLHDSYPHTWQVTRLTRVDRVVVAGDRAWVAVRIDSEVGLGADGAPPYTASSLDVRARYQWENGGWVLREAHSLGHG